MSNKISLPGLTLEKLNEMRMITRLLKSGAQTELGRARFDSDLKLFDQIEKEIKTVAPKYKARPVKEAIDDLYGEIARDKRGLSMTIVMCELWFEFMFLDDNFYHHIDSLEEIILDKAKDEWGQDTTAVFDRLKCTVLIVNFKKQRKFSFPTDWLANKSPRKDPNGAA